MQKDIIEKNLKLIAKKHNLSLLILFGSRAKNKEKKESDWDIAYYPPKKFNVNNEIKLFEELITILKNEKVDLINIKTSKKLHVINNIFQTGILIHEKKKGLFIKMKWDAWMNLQDFKHYYEKQFELTKKQLAEMV